MKDSQIRKSFLYEFITVHYFSPNNPSTVINELGIQHGKYRADIAIINGNIIGFEIKSDADSLQRLNNQIYGYGTVFDRVSIIVTEHHLNDVITLIPEWWGIILAREEKHNSIHFNPIRKSEINIDVDDYSVIQLLWRNEVQEILFNIGLRGRILMERRSNLYSYAVEMINSHELRNIVRHYLKKRKFWRCREILSPSGD